MCDYSLQSVRTRPAKVGEKLVTHNFGTGTRGFAAPEDCSVAVCVLPSTELAFRDVRQVSNHPHVPCQYRPHRCDLSPDQQWRASHPS
jgi:hypothetical protein